MTLVELCAGSAALSLRLLSGCRPLAPYSGGKGRWANRIASQMALGAPERCVLVDPGPWGAVWRDLHAHRAQVQARLDEWAAVQIQPHYGPRQIFDRIKAEPVPDDPGERIARFLLLQTLSFRSKPVGVRDGRWVCDVYSKTHGEGLALSGGWGEVKPQLPKLARTLRNLRRLDRIEGHQCLAQDIEPIPGAVVYLDPPYAGTTGYGPDDLTREQVLALAARWRAAGCRVAISEAEPIPGYRAIRLGDQARSSGLSGTGEGRVEWLSMSWAPQLGLFQ